MKQKWRERLNSKMNPGCIDKTSDSVGIKECEFFKFIESAMISLGTI